MTDSVVLLDSSVTFASLDLVDWSEREAAEQKGLRFSVWFLKCFKRARVFYR